MNQSIDKIANLLLARKVVNSLPANTSMTLRELNALIVDFRGKNSAGVAGSSASLVSSSSTPIPQSFLAVSAESPSTHFQNKVSRFETASPRFPVSVAQLSSVSNLQTDWSCRNQRESTNRATIGIRTHRVHELSNLQFCHKCSSESPWPSPSAQSNHLSSCLMWETCFDR